MGIVPYTTETVRYKSYCKRDGCGLDPHFWKLLNYFYFLALVDQVQCLDVQLNAQSL